MRITSIAVVIAATLTLALTVYTYCAPIIREVSRALS